MECKKTCLGIFAVENIMSHDDKKVCRAMSLIRKLLYSVRDEILYVNTLHIELRM